MSNGLNDRFDRSPEEHAAASKYLDGVGGFAPHDGYTSDINLHAADLMDEPRPEKDPARRATQPTPGKDNG